MTTERIEVARFIPHPAEAIFPIISETALRATLGILERTLTRRAEGRG